MPLNASTAAVVIDGASRLGAATARRPVRCRAGTAWAAGEGGGMDNVSIIERL